MPQEWPGALCPRLFGATAAAPQPPLAAAPTRLASEGARYRLGLDEPVYRAQDVGAAHQEGEMVRL